VKFLMGTSRACYEHFDRFNFTTDESKPRLRAGCDRPEMLGRVFEPSALGETRDGVRP